MPEKDLYSREDVARIVADTKMAMRQDVLEQSLSQHMDKEEKSFAALNAKIDLILKDQQSRSKELTDFRLEIKKEMEEDFITRSEFKALRNSIVWAVGIIVAIGGAVQWVLTVMVSLGKL